MVPVIQDLKEKKVKHLSQRDKQVPLGTQGPEDSLEERAWMEFLELLDEKGSQDLKVNWPSLVRRGTGVIRGILAALDPQDLQDQLDHQAMDRRESPVRRVTKAFLESLEPLEKPVLRENPVFRHQSQGPQVLQGTQAVLAPEVHLVVLDSKENAITQVFLGLMVNQEFQELDSLGLLDLKETEVFQEQKDHRVILEKLESQAYLESQVSQEPRENQE